MGRVTKREDGLALTGCGWVTPLAAGNLDEVIVAARGQIHVPELVGDYWPVPDAFLANCGLPPAEARADKTAAMVALAVQLALNDARLDPGLLESARAGLVLGSAFAGQLGMIRFAEEVRAQGPRFVSPLHFPQTVGNHAAGAVARLYQLRGPNLTLARGSLSGFDALLEASRFIANKEADVLLAGGADEFSQPLAASYARPSDSAPLAEGACFFVVERHSTATARGVCPRARLLDGDEVDEQGIVLKTFVAKWQSGFPSIEGRVGHCPGASGPAAVAEAIAAL